MAKSPKHPAGEHHHKAASHHYAAAHHHHQAGHHHDLGETKRRRSTPLRLLNIASLPINIPRLPTVILTNDEGRGDL